MILPNPAVSRGAPVVSRGMLPLTQEVLEMGRGELDPFHVVEVSVVFDVGIGERSGDLTVYPKVAGFLA